MLTCFSAESIVCRSALSPSDWQDLPVVVKKAGANYMEIEKFDENTPDGVKRLCNMSDKVTLRVRLSKEGWCDVERMTEKEIIMSHVHLYPGDVSSLAQLLSVSQSWQVKGGLNLYSLSCDDWGELAQLVQSLDSVWGVVMTGDLPPQLDAGLVRQLWGKTEGWWKVDGESYSKSDESHLDTILNKYCQ